MHKVLLVDDVSMFVQLQKTYLEPSGLTVVTASSGREAVEICRAERPELVFMDLSMPVMDGAAACAAIRQDPRLADIPIVLINSDWTPEDLARCEEAGCNDTLTKPLDRSLFLEMARRYLPTMERRNRRVNCCIKAAYRAGGTSHSGVIMNIGLEALYLCTEWEAESGAQLDVVFALPEPHAAIIQARGEVSRTNALPGETSSLPRGFALTIVKIEPAARESLARFVDRPGYPIEPVLTAS